MTLTNRDASQITLKKTQKALFAWKNDNNNAVLNGGNVLREQPTFQSSRVVVDRQQGGCKCSADASANPYQFNGLSVCGGCGN